MRNKDAVETSLQLAAHLCNRGVPLNFAAINFPNDSKSGRLLTDMPPYPWQHSTRYWHESRVTRNHRKRQWPRHDLLGTLVEDMSDFQAEWKNILRLSDLPWLEHHRVQSQFVFPLAGYLSMALEAVRQRAISRNIEFDDYAFRDFSVNRPLLLLSTGEVEVRITLRPCEEGKKISSEFWEEFQVLSWNSDGGWFEQCRGLIGVQKSNHDNPIDGYLQLQHKQHSTRHKILTISEACSSEIDISGMYRTLADLGFAYSEIFMGLTNCRASSTHSVAEVPVPETVALMPEAFESEYTIHPVTLDIIMQTLWPILGAAGGGLEKLYVPSFIKSMTISKDIAMTTGHSFLVYASGMPADGTMNPQKYSLFAMQTQDSTLPCISFDGYVMTPVQDKKPRPESTFSEDLCFKLIWEPASKADNAISREADPLLPFMPNGDNSNGVPHTSSAFDSSSPVIINRSTLNGVPQNSSSSDPSSPVVPNGIVSGGFPYNSFTSDVMIITHDGQNHLPDLSIPTLITALERSTGKTPVVSALEDADTEGKIIVFLVELANPYLSTIDARVFECLRSMTANSSGIVWPVRGAYRDSASPDSNMVAGFARTVRSETALKFVTLDFAQEPTLPPEDVAEMIATVFNRVFITDSSQVLEMEYSERSGSLCVPRLIPDKPLNDFVRHNRGRVDAKPYPQLFLHRGRKLKMIIARPGSLDSMHFVDDDSPNNVLAVDDIEIEVKAIGLNFKDVVIAMGQLPGGCLGQECSGIVTAVGSQATNISVGDRVTAVSPGCIANVARCRGSNAIRIPEDMTFEVAATLPIIYSTAYYSLVDVGRLSRGEKVLIHAAAGGVGQAAIGLAQMIGAEIFATVGSLSKKEFLMERFGLPEANIFYSRNVSFRTSILRMTNNEGVDVILNSLAGSALHATWDCLSAFGRFIEIGKKDITDNTRIGMAPFARNVTFASVDLAVIAAERPQLMQRLLNDVVQMYLRNELHLVSPLITFPVSEVESAIRTLQGGKSLGKIVIVPGCQDLVQVSRSQSLSI